MSALLTFWLIINHINTLNKPLCVINVLRVKCCSKGSNKGIILERVEVHYNDVIMGAIASQITSLTIVHSIVYSDADQRKHQSSASLAFVRGIHRGPVNSPHKWPVTWKMFPSDDVIMCFNWFSRPELPCTVDNCDTCVEGRPEVCELCQDGYCTVNMPVDCQRKHDVMMSTSHEYRLFVQHQIDDKLEHQQSAIMVFSEWNPLVGSPRKSPAMQEMFACHNVIKYVSVLLSSSEPVGRWSVGWVGWCLWQGHVLS